MFNLFKKDNFNRKVPDEYKHLMDQRTYESMLDIILQYFKEKGEPVLKVENGYIMTKGEDGDELEHQYGLDNLVRLVAIAAPADMESVIYTHFNKAYYDMRPLEYFKTDYGAAKQYLKILIKPDRILQEKGGKDVVHKTIFPGTCSVLVFDYDNKFVYLYKEMVKEWDKTTDELFEEALFNIGGEDISVVGIILKTDGEETEEPGKKPTLDPDDQDAFIFINPDFAAPAVCLIEQKASFAIGQYGSIVTIPSKGYALVAPINGHEIFDKVSPMSILALKFFNEQPGSITTDFYWYYQGSFHLMEETQSTDKEGYLAIKTPPNLSQLLNEE